MPDLNWWEQLEPQWKNAFSTVFFRHSNVPAAAAIEQLFNTPALRFVGPGAPYPNLSFELTNLSGIELFENLEILVVTHHQIKDITCLSSFRKLKSLFLFNNQIESLSGIEHLLSLEQLYVQYNNISSLQPIRHLTNLKEVYVNNNAICTLEGITEAHSDKLTTFFCRPNNSLKQKEIIYTENQLGIKCHGL